MLPPAPRLDHHRLLQRRRQLLGDRTADDVERPAGRRRHDDAHGMGRVSLRRRRLRGGEREACREQRRERCACKTHRVLLHVMAAQSYDLHWVVIAGLDPAIHLPRKELSRRMDGPPRNRVYPISVLQMRKSDKIRLAWSSPRVTRAGGNCSSSGMRLPIHVVPCTNRAEKPSGPGTIATTCGAPKWIGNSSASCSAQDSSRRRRDTAASAGRSSAMWFQCGA